MKSKSAAPQTIDAFIAAFPRDVQPILQKVRATIAKAAPGATETIAYGIPTFKLHGNLVHFSGYKKHVGFYPGSKAIETFRQDIAAYQSAKGSVQFPLDQPIPYALIAKIVKHRVKENRSKAKK